MSDWLFPDNTVLCNFAAVGELDLLESVLRGRGRWTEAVEQEARQSAAWLPSLGRPLPWLGQPVEVTETTEIRSIEGIRRAVFGGSGDEPTKHLGEAQTCYLLQTRAEFRSSWWVSDDREAVRYARAQGITTRETCDVLAEAASMGDVTEDGGYAILRAMEAAGRHLRIPLRSQFP